MTSWLLVFWLGGMAGGPATVAGIGSEAECRALAVKIGAWDRRGSGLPPIRHECIKYEARQ